MSSMLDRREFLTLGAAGLFVGCRQFGSPDAGAEPLARFGIVTDIHYADKDFDKAPCDVVGRRFFRESLRKMDEAVAVFNGRSLDFAIELGDFKDDSSGRDPTLAHLERIEASFARFSGPRYHVAGNHDFDCLTPDEFFSRVPNDGEVSHSGYYSFVRGGVKFIVLNACYDSALRPYSRNNPWNDANVPPDELAWLERELAAAEGHVIVFCHQRLEDSAEPNHLVKNAADVRALVERSGKVRAVITGHQHKGSVRVLNGIVYYSLRALVCDSGEGANSFAEVAVYPSGAVTVTGWRNAVSLGAKGEFPGRGLVVKCDDAAARGGAEMVLADASPRLEGELADFPKAGVLLGVRCSTVAAALEAAETLRRAGRLAQGVLMMDSREDFVGLKAKCAWARAGLAMHPAGGSGASWPEAEAWKALRDAAKIDAVFVELPSDFRCTPEQFVFLHDRGIRTVCFSADDPKTVARLVREGHDFVFTDSYSRMRCAFDAAVAER